MMLEDSPIPVSNDGEQLPPLVHTPSKLAQEIDDLSRSGIPPSRNPPSDAEIDRGWSESESSDPGVFPSSPIRGTKEEQDATRRRKSQRKRRKTNDLKKEQLAAAQAEREQELLLEEARQRALALQHLQTACLAALDVLADAKVSLGDFLLFVLDPDIRVSNLADRRWAEVLHKHDTVYQILGFWTTASSTPLSVRERVQRWMVAYVASLAAQEARAITRGGILRLQARDTSMQSVLSFDVTSLHATLREHVPIMLQVSESFATSRKQRLAPSPRISRRKELVVSQSLASLLREHSRFNNRVANHNSLYLYASGAQRQTITMLSHLGVSSSYTTLIRKARRSATVREIGDGSPDEESLTADASSTQDLVGILPALSTSCMEHARKLAATDEYSDTYDNVNMIDKIAEQILGRKDSLESGTASALAKLFKVVASALSASAADAAFLSATILTIDNLIFSRVEVKTWQSLNEETICWIAIHYGGDELARFEAAFENGRKRDAHEIPLHTSEIFPLQTMDIDEASITGNVDVVNAIHEQLGLNPNSPDFLKSVRLFFGDQLTVARQRAIIAARAGHERDGESWSWAKPIAGLFHTDMAAVTCVINTHYGATDSGTRDPGSLWFHNTALDRKPIVLSSLPPYRVCRDLVFASLYSRVLHCLVRASGSADLAAFSRSVTSLAQLRQYARLVLQTCASAKQVAELRSERINGTSGPNGDDVFENASLFMRDALALRTFSLLIKSGRSGHIVLALKWLSFAFKAGGHPKYAREMLHLVHNLTTVWPKPLRDLILNNWLVNPTGTKDGWIAMDLMQEHLNFWIKRIYAAHGSNASWEWLKTISPCVNILRKLANQVHATLGSYQGRKHQSPSLARDIEVLMKSLNDHAVYEIRRGRRIADSQTIPDLQALGVQQMMTGANATLAEYNSEFRTLQARSRVKPLQPFIAGDTQREAQPVEELQTSKEATRDAEQPARTDAAASVSGQVAVHVPEEGHKIEPFLQAHADRAASEDADGSAPGSAGSDPISSSSESSDSFEVDSELDELFLSLEDEGDVSLDPDRDWAEEESSGDESADFDDGQD